MARLAFIALTLVVGTLALISLQLALIGLSVVGVDAVSTLREDDAVCLLEAAFAVGAAAFGRWGAGVGLATFVRRRSELQRFGMLLALPLTFAAVMLAGFFVERRWDESRLAPSLGMWLVAATLTAALALVERRRV